MSQEHPAAVERMDFDGARRRLELSEVPIELSAVGRPGAEASMETLQRGPLHFSRIRLGAHRASHALGPGTSRWMVNIQLSGSAELHTAAGTVSMDSGDMVVFDTERPYTIASSGTGDIVNFSWLKSSSPAPPEGSGQLLGRPLGRSGPSAVASVTTARIVAAGGMQQLATASGRNLLAALRELVVGALADEVAPSRTTLRWTEVAAYADDHIGDPALGARRIATAAHCSVRTVHAAFQARGTTPGAWILERRLTLARRLLADPDWRDHRIADIARLCGFTDPAYFSRTFRTLHGVSPREFRLRN
jgi:AraC-like DNA-binding protein